MNNLLKITAVLALGLGMIACSNNKNGADGSDTTMISSEETTSTSTSARVVPGSYTELNSGKTVYVVADPATGWAIDSISKAPVEFYIDRSGDTLFQSGLVVNHAIMKTDGKWMLDEAKIKRDGNDIKIKYADGSKVKMEEDDLKIKTEAGKIKIEEDTIKVKPKN